MVCRSIRLAAVELRGIVSSFPLIIPGVVGWLWAGSLELYVWGQGHPVLDSPENAAAIAGNGILIVIDPGPHRRPPQQLVDLCRRFSRVVVLLTHCHWDHTRGLAGLVEECGSLEAYASRHTVEYMSRIDNVVDWVRTVLSVIGASVEMFDAYRGMFEGFYRDVVEASRYVRAIEDAMDVVSELGVAVYECPGHTMGHLCYRVGGIMFAGDNVTEPSTPVVMDLDPYLETLEIVERVGWETLVPGHGRVMGRREGLEAVRAIRLRKLRRLVAIVDYLLRVGETDALKLIEAAYGPARHEFEYFTRAYNTVGYLQSLVRRGVVEVERSSPWRVRLVDREVARKLLDKLRVEVGSPP